MSVDLFSALQEAPDDPILGLNELYKKDTRTEKVNLGVGVFLNEEGKLPLMKAVAEAEKRLLERAAPHNYIPMSGLPGYTAAVQQLVFGAGSEPVLSGRVATIQTLGGTGALHLGSLFAHACLGATDSVVSNPTWGNHISIFQHAGLTVGKYPYFDAATGGVNFEGMLAHLKTLAPKTVVLLHACCHNPTGADLTHEQWHAVADVVRERGLIPFLDMAYQGFGDGLDEDAYAPRYFAQCGISFLVSSSCSKNFGLYGQRAGGLHVVTPNAREAQVVVSILKTFVRKEYSNPPTHGAAAVAEILNDAELRQCWVDEVTGMRARIHDMRHLLVEEGKKAGTDLSFAVRQAGMFSFTGLSADQMIELREKHAVYGVNNGRICVAGLNHSNCEYVAQAIAAVR